MTRRFALAAALAPALVLAAQLPCPGAARAQVGSTNVASIEPPQAHPATAPCVVPLYRGATFGGDAVPYQYAPPAACPGPWAKVVLSVDISLDAGRQYDRTGTIWLGGVYLWFGTTAEPGASLAPRWHVERDVTDDTALFRSPNRGQVLIANYLSSADTSTITSSASLAFYPADAADPAPRTPDLVIPLGAGPGATATLDTGGAVLSRTLMLPSNIERAALDTVLQGQSADEFWYANVPDALATELEEGGGGAFREGELTVDGKGAGLAPVYPAIFTGGIDPFLWKPVPGVSTLDLRPFRIELTPFAGELDQPGPHTIALSVFGASNFFSAEGTLYLYLDKGASADSGALTRDDFGPPAPTLVNTLTGGTDIKGSLVTASTHAYVIAGSLSTSHGTVSTQVDATSVFRNTQTFSITPSTSVQDVAQDTRTSLAVTTRSAAGTQVATSRFSYPLTVDISETGTDTRTITQATKVSQGLLLAGAGAGPAAGLLAEGILSQDTVPFLIDPATGSVSVGTSSGAASAAFYGSSGAAGCTARLLASTENVLRAEQQTSDCATAARAAR